MKQSADTTAAFVGVVSLIGRNEMRESAAGDHH
jgi:hypothetical protein